MCKRHKARSKETAAEVPWQGSHQCLRNLLELWLKRLCLCANTSGLPAPDPPPPSRASPLAQVSSCPCFPLHSTQIPHHSHFLHTKTRFHRFPLPPLQNRQDVLPSDLSFCCALNLSPFRAGLSSVPVFVGRAAFTQLVWFFTRECPADSHRQSYFPHFQNKLIQRHTQIRSVMTAPRLAGSGLPHCRDCARSGGPERMALCPAQPEWRFSSRAQWKTSEPGWDNERTRGKGPSVHPPIHPRSQSCSPHSRLPPVLELGISPFLHSFAPEPILSSAALHTQPLPYILIVTSPGRHITSSM